MARVSKSIDEIREEIIRACIALFNQKGLKFTMDDVANYCRISKKTMYVVFNDKETLFLAVVDYLFDGIKESEAEVINDTSLSTIEKIKKILGVMPESYKELDFGKMLLIKEKYPAIYEKVEERLETGWEKTLELLERGVKEGVIRNVDISIVKIMFEASVEQFFRRDIINRDKINYHKALNQVVEIILEGIKA